MSLIFSIYPDNTIHIHAITCVVCTVLALAVLWHACTHVLRGVMAHMLGAEMLECVHGRGREEIPQPRSLVEWVNSLGHTLVDTVGTVGAAVEQSAEPASSSTTADAGLGSAPSSDVAEVDVDITAEQFVSMLCSKSICFQGECFSKASSDGETSLPAEEEVSGWRSVVPEFILPYSLRAPKPSAPMVPVRPFQADNDIAFEATSGYDGARAGMVFKMGSQGLGYYDDVNAPHAPHSEQLMLSEPVA